VVRTHVLRTEASRGGHVLSHGSIRPVAIAPTRPAARLTVGEPPADTLVHTLQICGPTPRLLRPDRAHDRHLPRGAGQRTRRKVRL